MTFLVERLAELRRHVEHLRGLAPKVGDRFTLERDLSLHNDVMFSPHGGAAGDRPGW